MSAENGPHRVRDIQPGDRFTFLYGMGLDDENYYYVASPTWDAAGQQAVTHFWKADDKTVSTEVTDLYTDPNESVFIIERNKENNTVSSTEHNDVKLELAADYGLQAKFSYTNEEGETRVRRVRVEDYDGEYVEGESFDENGVHEGYRRFRLDRFNDSAVIR